MRIDPRIAAYAPAATARNGRAAGAPAFRLGAEATGSAAAARSAAPLATLDAILMLQAGDGGRERRRRSARRGADLLDALDDLKASLLSGAIPPADLRRLAARLAEAAGSSGDPGLDETIAMIELRAKVELAKLGVRA